MAQWQREDLAARKALEAAAALGKHPMGGRAGAAMSVYEADVGRRKVEGTYAGVVVEASEQRMVREGAMEQRVRIRSQRNVGVER